MYPIAKAHYIFSKALRGKNANTNNVRNSDEHEYGWNGSETENEC